ncbi:hypothetical protein G9444_2912 [Rhodococcus erythropolis]|uniref:Uncharacterized protein n=1 Tax=Rhodococcus erythropolis TaxID=1833 RepID=A0A6G9CTX6_RHOER|nr:hypothetical protein G9444_2912 [Rhodococcus erythropolis]
MALGYLEIDLLQDVKFPKCLFTEVIEIMDVESPEVVGVVASSAWVINENLRRSLRRRP